MAIAQMPFTKIVEDVMLEMRENSSEASVERKYQRRVNDIYVRDIPSKNEFDCMRKEGTFTINAAYDTGTITSSGNSTAITGVGTTWTSSHNNYRLKISGNDEIYTFTFTNTTTGALNTAFTGTNSSSGLTYVLYQDTYNLASDYDRAVIPPGFYYDYSNSKVIIPQKFHKDWFKTYTTSKTSLPDGWRFTGQLDSTNQYWRIQIGPPVSASRIIKYEYIPQLTEMIEYTTGTASSTSGTTTIHGITTDFTCSSVSLGDAFRFDSRPNDWYIITATTNATTLTIGGAYPTSVSSGNYTICKIPVFPIKLQMAVFYGACALSSLDQADENSKRNYETMYKQQLAEYNAEINRMKYGKQRMTVNEMYRNY